MSYGINRLAKVAPDAEKVVSHLYKVLPCVVRRWAITQALNALEQLNHGIRYAHIEVHLNRTTFIKYCCTFELNSSLTFFATHFERSNFLFNFSYTSLNLQFSIPFGIGI